MITECHNSLNSLEGGQSKSKYFPHPTCTEQMFSLQTEWMTTKYNDLEVLKPKKSTTNCARSQTPNYKCTILIQICMNPEQCCANRGLIKCIWNRNLPTTPPRTVHWRWQGIASTWLRPAPVQAQQPFINLTKQTAVMLFQKIVPNISVSSTNLSRQFLQHCILHS